MAAAAPAPLGASPIVPYESKTKAKLATLNGDVDYKKVPPINNNNNNENKNKNKSRLQANNSHPASSCRQPPIYIPPFPRLFAQQMKDNRNRFWFVSKYFSPQLAMVNDDLLKVKQRETQETFMRRVKVRPFTFPPIINEKNEKWKFILSLFTTTIIPGKWKYILSPFYHYHHQRLPFLSISSSHTVKVKVRSFALQMSSVLYFYFIFSKCDLFLYVVHHVIKSVPSEAQWELTSALLKIRGLHSLTCSPMLF